MEQTQDTPEQHDRKQTLLELAMRAKPHSPGPQPCSQCPANGQVCPTCATIAQVHARLRKSG